MDLIDKNIKEMETKSFIFII